MNFNCHEQENIILHTMNQVNHIFKITPAIEKVLQWQGSQINQSRKEVPQQLLYGLLKLAVVAGLIIVTILTTS
jgi:hypothetical protein